MVPTGPQLSPVPDIEQALNTLRVPMDSKNESSHWIPRRSCEVVGVGCISQVKKEEEELAREGEELEKGCGGLGDSENPEAGHCGN